MHSRIKPQAITLTKLYCTRFCVKPFMIQNIQWTHEIQSVVRSHIRARTHSSSHAIGHSVNHHSGILSIIAQAFYQSSLRLSVNHHPDFLSIITQALCQSTFTYRLLEFDTKRAIRCCSQIDSCSHDSKLSTRLLVGCVYTAPALSRLFCSAHAHLCVPRKCTAAALRTVTLRASSGQRTHGDVTILRCFSTVVTMDSKGFVVLDDERRCCVAMTHPSSERVTD